MSELLRGLRRPINRVYLLYILINVPYTLVAVKKEFIRYLGIASLGLRGRYPRLPYTSALTKPDIRGCIYIKIGGVHASKGVVHLSVPKIYPANQ